MEKDELHQDVRDVSRQIEDDVEEQNLPEHNQRWDTMLLVFLLVVNLLGVGFNINQSREAAKLREQSAVQAQVRQEELTQATTALGTCVVELLVLNPPRRNLSNVRKLCPEGVLSLMEETRNANSDSDLDSDSDA